MNLRATVNVRLYVFLLHGNERRLSPAVGVIGQGLFDLLLPDARELLDSIGLRALNTLYLVLSGGHPDVLRRLPFARVAGARAG